MSSAQTHIEWLRMMAEHSHLTDCKPRFRQMAADMEALLDVAKDAGKALTDAGTNAFLRGEINAIVKRVEAGQ